MICYNSRPLVKGYSAGTLLQPLSVRTSVPTKEIMRFFYATYSYITNLGLGWVVEDDLTDDVLKKSLSSKWL